jgi:hypothetical protein
MTREDIMELAAIALFSIALVGFGALTATAIISAGLASLATFGLWLVALIVCACAGGVLLA